ncbi:MAG: hypothetical protein IOC82_08480 [Aestuariivirga sp.]|uniref:hypothetical protein n=1 Tax=Aestuariivirga sp. TaxID=2650926 RepID=UPI0025C07BDE|nr:hypothetical protein [Aestuariivirga sp.]MCA3561046.1 hypothetical protein [Aestuariivirga sp.]
MISRRKLILALGAALAPLAAQAATSPTPPPEKAKPVTKAPAKPAAAKKPAAKKQGVKKKAPRHRRA